MNIEYEAFSCKNIQEAEDFYVKISMEHIKNGYREYLNKKTLIKAFHSQIAFQKGENKIFNNCIGISYYIDENNYYKSSIYGKYDRHKWYVHNFKDKHGEINNPYKILNPILIKVHIAYENHECKPDEWSIVIRYFNGFVN